MAGVIKSIRESVASLTSRLVAVFARIDGSNIADPTTFRANIGAGTGNGTVTSVAATVPSGFSVGGSPVTSSGTLALSYATGQTANRFLATPNGSTGAMSLRAVVKADLSGATVPFTDQANTFSTGLQTFSGGVSTTTVAASGAVTTGSVTASGDLQLRTSTDHLKFSTNTGIYVGSPNSSGSSFLRGFMAGGLVWDETNTRWTNNGTSWSGIFCENLGVTSIRGETGLSAGTRTTTQVNSATILYVKPSGVSIGTSSPVTGFCIAATSSNTNACASQDEYSAIAHVQALGSYNSTFGRMWLGYNAYWNVNSTTWNRCLTNTPVVGWQADSSGNMYYVYHAAASGNISQTTFDTGRLFAVTNAGVWTAQANTSTSNRSQFDLTPTWATSTDASRKARVVCNVYDAGGAREFARAESDGSRGYWIQQAQTTAPADAMMVNNSIAFWINSGVLTCKYKDNSGTVKTLAIGTPA